MPTPRPGGYPWRRYTTDPVTTFVRMIKMGESVVVDREQSGGLTMYHASTEFVGGVVELGARAYRRYTETFDNIMERLCEAHAPLFADYLEQAKGERA